MRYETDAGGQKVLLNEGGYQVMMEWEKPYMEALIDALQPFGDVLEIGFGLGYSASRIQEHRPKSHTIVECDPHAANAARKWAAERPNVRIIEETWQNALPRLLVFDAIFFDDYPLGSDAPTEAAENKRDAAHSILREGKALFKQIEERFPHLKNIVYKDADLDALCQSAPEKKFLSPFFHELHRNGQITKEQYDRMLQKHGVEEIDASVLLPPLVPDRTMEFLHLCLKHHMRRGSRFSAFSGSPLSKYEHPAFFEEIILNPNLEYREFTIPIDVSKTCRYYKHSDALVMVVEKMR